MLEGIDNFLTNVLLKVAPGDVESIEADAQEIQDDLRSEGSRSFFGGCALVWPCLFLAFTDA